MEEDEKSSNHQNSNSNEEMDTKKKNWRSDFIKLGGFEYLF